MTIIQKFFEEESYIVIYRVDPEDAGIRLDLYLQDHFKTFSREWVKGKIKKGEIEIKGRPGKLKPSTKLLESDEVIITTYRHHLEDEWWDGDKLELEKPTIVHEDEHLLVINKPPFMSAHPTGGHLFNTATGFYERVYGHTMRTVHRLDRETSGLLVMAKDAEHSNIVREEFEEGRVSKCYFLISKLKTPLPESTFPLEANERLSQDGKGDRSLFIEAYPEYSLYGRHARTDFLLLEHHHPYLVALAFPHTGRQHQIRVHAQIHGFPLLGDKIYYGGTELFGRFKDREDSSEDRNQMEIPRQALHNIGIEFKYIDEMMTFISPLPHDLESWMQKKMPQVDLKEMTKRIHEEIKNYFFHKSNK